MKKKKSKLGIGFSRKKMVYTKYGYLWWAPRCVQSFIVNIYNYFACRVVGHYWIEDTDPIRGAIWKNRECIYFSHYICCDCCLRKSKEDIEND